MFESMVSECRGFMAEDGKNLKLDSLTIQVCQDFQLGVRLARNQICRENVFVEDQYLLVEMSLEGRNVNQRFPFPHLGGVKGLVHGMCAELERTPKDPESVTLTPLACDMHWSAAANRCATLVDPEVLAKALEKQLVPCRAADLRVSGFLDVKGMDQFILSTPATSIRLSSEAISVKIAIDDPKSGACGSAMESTTDLSAESLENLLERAFASAKKTCERNTQPVEMAPADVPVILSPAALHALLYSVRINGFLEARRIDEGRTWLSQNRQSLAFCPSLRWRGDSIAELPGGIPYAEPPLGSRLNPASSIDLIRGGRVSEVFHSAWWAQKKGVDYGYGSNPPVMRFWAEDGVAGSRLERVRDLESLIARTHYAILIMDLWYIRKVSDMSGVLTGMTRDGVFEVMDGRVVRALRNFRWHQNPLELLSRATGISTELSCLGTPRFLDGGGLSLVPALRADGFHLSSVTRF